MWMSDMLYCVTVEPFFMLTQFYYSHLIAMLILCLHEQNNAQPFSYKNLFDIISIPLWTNPTIPPLRIQNTK